MRNYTINKGHGDERSVEAARFRTEGDFVDPGTVSGWQRRERLTRMH